MTYRKRALFAILALMMAALACNMPIVQKGGNNQIPGPEQTMTALFAITPNAKATATATLPPVVTSTAQGGVTQPTVAPATTAPTSAPATAAPAPTSGTAPTTAPQASATIPGVRPRGQAVAKYLTKAPTIDGDWSEWKDITTEYPIGIVVWGPDKRTGDDDLMGSFHIGWDDNNLYIAVKVRDDTYVQNASGENIYKGDSVEILMDTKLQEDFYYTSLSPDDFQLGISPGRPDANGVREAYLWLPSNIAGARTNVTIAAIQSNGVWRMEAAIPWNVFETKPTAGQHMGFAISISDDDTPGTTEQQSMVSNVGTRRLTDPTTWGDIQFTK
jgi:hypothetical protein